MKKKIALLLLCLCLFSMVRKQSEANGFNDFSQMSDWAWGNPGHMSIELYWKPVDGAKGYVLHRGDGDSTEPNIWISVNVEHDGPVDFIPYADFDVTPGTTYHYRIFAAISQYDPDSGMTFWTEFEPNPPRVVSVPYY